MNPEVGSAFGELLRERRGQLGLTLQAAAERAGCARSYLYMLEVGQRRGPVGAEVLSGLERALELPVGRLVEMEAWQRAAPVVRHAAQAVQAEQSHAAQRLRGMIRSAASLDEAFRSGALKQLVERLEGPEGAGKSDAEGDRSAARGVGGMQMRAVPVGRLLPRQVPLINKVAAGYPREFTDLSYPARCADDWVRSPDVEDPDAFALRVCGDSMMPEYRDGDIVIFSPAKPLKSGMDCLVRLERDDETTFKRIEFVLGPGGEECSARIRLVALNAAYAAREVAREDVAFMCAAVSVTRVVG